MDNKNYKIVTFKGGLGNQLFQYSLAIYLKQELNQNVKLDLSWFKTQDKRKFLLNDYLKVEFDIIDENYTNLLDRIISYRSETIISKSLKIWSFSCSHRTIVPELNVSNKSKINLPSFLFGLRTIEY